MATEAQEAALRRYREMAEYAQRNVVGVPDTLPTVRYWGRMAGEYRPPTPNLRPWAEIWLPTPEHLAEVHGTTVRECSGDHEYLFLHELAHWATTGEGHTARMYGVAFCFYKMFGLRMRIVKRLEREYKPRASRAGYRRYLRAGRELARDRAAAVLA